jgi:hypothetical protein
MVFNGRKYVVGNKREEIDWTLQRVQRADGPPLLLTGSALNIPAADRRNRPAADVWLVRYDPHTVNVPVGSGENAGVTLPHRNVVHALTRLGGWDGSAETFTVPPSPDGLSTAILLQEPGGAILSAVKL